MAHMRLSDLIESYYSNLTDQVKTDSSYLTLFVEQLVTDFVYLAIHKSIPTGLYENYLRSFLSLPLNE
jgi:hypothetical protein